MEYSRIKMKYSFNRIANQYVKWLLFIYLGFVLFSCSSIKNIEIQVAALPEYPIADDVQSLVLLNRSVNMQFSNIPTDSLEKILINRRMSLEAVFRDSTAADTVIRVAAQALFNSGRFDVVIPKEPSIIRYDHDDIASALDSSTINNICKEYNVDAVLILESFAEKLATKYYFKPEYGSYENVYSATSDVGYDAQWRFYRSGNHQSPYRFQVRDSIFWQNSSHSIPELYEQMPRTKEALIGGGIASGVKMAEFISPGWLNQSRHYFVTGKKEIDSAIPYLQENKWEEAALIWSKFAMIKSKRIRSEVEFNIALAAEMAGNLELAIEWGLKSFKTNYSQAAEVYLRNLYSIRSSKQHESKLRY